MFSWQRTVAASLALLVVGWAALAHWQQHRFASVISITDSDRPYKITTELRKFIEDVRQNGTIPGLSVALVQSTGYSESTVDLEGFGDSTEAGGKVTPETLFSIASCSKAFLAGSLGILMDDFKNKRNVTSLPAGLEVFDWHTRLKDLLPQDWGMMDMWTHEKATVRDILTHVSGLPRHDLSYTASDSPVDVIRRMRHLRPSFELREKHQYINQMFVLATHIIALYSGTPYIEFVTQRILAPLQMSLSTFSELEANETGLLSHAFKRDGRRIPFWFPDSVKILTAGPGGIISNARDMARWIQMLLNEGVDPSTNKTVLPRAVYQAMTSAHSVASPAPYPEFSDINYGFGWTRYSYQSHEILQHSGAIPGYSTQIALLPRDGLGIVVLCNASQKEKQAMAIVYRVIESILGLPRTASSRFTAAPQLSKSHVRTEPIAPNNSHPPHSEKISKENIAHENVSLEKYVGTYTNPGYPNITICSPTHATSLHELDKVCRDTLKEFSSFDDPSTVGLTLYLSIPGLWVRHARLRPAGHDRFSVASTYLFPEGYGRDKTPFELSEMIGFMGDVEFAVDDRGNVVGFGLDNSDVTAVPSRSREGGDIKGTAGVWFNKA